ncbi:hypothetical protein CLOP_g4087 [Closterium sp. NIES-67]|nr:hypothetical protein CLOP_g4087 [Closterium sp. NIES-67]
MGGSMGGSMGGGGSVEEIEYPLSPRSLSGRFLGMVLEEVAEGEEEEAQGEGEGREDAGKGKQQGCAGGSRQKGTGVRQSPFQQQQQLQQHILLNRPRTGESMGSERRSFDRFQEEHFQAQRSEVSTLSGRSEGTLSGRSEGVSTQSGRSEGVLSGRSEGSLSDWSEGEGAQVPARRSCSARELERADRDGEVSAGEAEVLPREGQSRARLTQTWASSVEQYGVDRRGGAQRYSKEGGERERAVGGRSGAGCMEGEAEMLQGANLEDEYLPLKRGPGWSPQQQQQQQQQQQHGRPLEMMGDAQEEPRAHGQRMVLEAEGQGEQGGGVQGAEQRTDRPGIQTGIFWQRGNEGIREVQREEESSREYEQVTRGAAEVPHEPPSGSSLPPDGLCLPPDVACNSVLIPNEMRIGDELAIRFSLSNNSPHPNPSLAATIMASLLPPGFVTLPGQTFFPARACVFLPYWTPNPSV